MSCAHCLRVKAAFECGHGCGELYCSQQCADQDYPLHIGASTGEHVYCDETGECFDFSPYWNMMDWEWKDHKGDAAFVQFRKAFVDWLLQKVVRNVGCKDECHTESVGSTTPTSDYDINVHGPHAPDIVNLFNDEFRHIFHKESAVVFDTNVYGASFVNRVRQGNFAIFDNKYRYVANAADEENQRKWALLKVYLHRHPTPLHWPAIAAKRRDLGTFLSLKTRNDLYGDSLYRVSKLKEEMLAQDEPNVELRQAYKEAISIANYYGQELYFTQGAYMHVVEQLQKRNTHVPITEDEYMDSFIENMGDTFKELEHGAVAFSKYLARAMDALLHIHRYKSNAQVRSLYEASETLRTQIRGMPLCQNECVLPKTKKSLSDALLEQLRPEPNTALWKIFLKYATF